MRPATPALEITDAQRELLTELSKSRTAPFREVQRARALLLAADGVANYLIGEQVGVSPATVAAWRTRFASEGLAKFGQVRKGRGPKADDPAVEDRRDRRADKEFHPGRGDPLVLPDDGREGRGVQGHGAAGVVRAGT